MLDETTYYFSAFALDTNGNILDTQTLSITTEFGWHPSANTFLYYSFDGQNLNDNSGNNRNGSWYSGAGSFTTGIKGYGANNGNRGIKIPSFINGDFTLSLRIKPTNNGLSIQTLFGSVEWGSSPGYMHFHMYNSQFSNISFALSGDTGTFNSSQSIDWNQWNHIVLTRQGNTYKIYKNKTLILTHEFAGSLIPNATWLIGNGYNNDRHVQGVFDEVIIETVVWSQSQINKYYDKIVS